MSDEAVTLWVKSLENGDQDAASQLWEYCFPRLLRYSVKRLPDNLRRVMDEEDIALSAFKSFCLGAKKGSFENLAGRDELWKLLLCITARKAQNHIRHETRKKRGGGKVSGESIFQLGKDNSGDQPTGGIGQVPEDGPSPELLAQITEDFKNYMDLLNDETLRAIAILRIEGYSVDEIADRVGCAKRSVERRLNLIRKTWTNQEEKGPEEKTQ